MKVTRTTLTIVTLSMLGASLVTATASAAYTLDRNYRLGDGDNETGTPAAGATVGSTSSGFTFDDEGTSGTNTLIDLQPLGNPIYANVSSRPLANGSTLGVQFDGVDDSLTGFRLGLPETSVSSTASTQIGMDSVTTITGTLDYTGISNRGYQFWVNPGDSALGSGLQAVVLDTNQHGVLIDNGNWAIRYNGQTVNTGVAVKTDSAGDGSNGWSHVMLVRPSSTAASASLYVDGEAVGAIAGGYNGGDATYLTLGANTGNLSNTSADDNPGVADFFTGIIDDLEMFVLGASNATQTDYGTFNLGTDNEFVANELNGILAADINADGSVNDADLTALSSNWLSRNLVNGVTVGDLSFRASGDVNFDGVVNLRDAVILHNGLLAAGSVTGVDFGLLGAASVPEPTSLGLLCLGLVFGASRLRQSKR